MKNSWMGSAPLLMLNVMCVTAAMAADQPAAAPGETQPDQPAATAKDQGMQEVVVTSQRRATKVQDIPIAETVLTGDQLRGKAVVSMADLVGAAPATSRTDTGLVSSFNIRGIGLSSGSAQATNGVATYIDGLFQPAVSNSASFYDIANIEILRGPQGTLVGSNSTGGAVLITTENPSLSKVEGYATVGVGNYRANNFQGALNVPLSDTLAFRIAGIHQQHDSYYTDNGPYHNKPGRLDENGGRLGVLLKTGQFQALLKIDNLDRKTGGAPYKPLPGSSNDVGVTGGIFDLYYNTPSKFDEKSLMTGLELKYQTDSGIVLRSLSGVQTKKVNALWDVNPSAALAPNLWDMRVRNREWSQEFNIISPATGRFNWILGAYYQQNKIDVTIIQPPIVTVGLENNLRTTGVFAQTGYKLADDLELQLGARKSGYRGVGTGGVFLDVPGAPPGGMQVADLAGRYSDGTPTGKLSLNWKATKTDLLYAFVARGYKNGNYNSATSQFKPETVLNYEAGWKSTLADGAVRTQFDVFYNNYKNFQIDMFDPTSGQTGVTNLPPSTIKGAEGQIQAKLRGFKVDAAFAYVASKLAPTSLIDTLSLPSQPLGPQCAPGVPSNPPACFDFVPYTFTSSGGPNLMSPKLTYNFGVDYKMELPNEMSLTPRLNVSYASGSYFFATYQRNAYIPKHTTVSALVTLQRDDWSADLYVNNLTNQAFVTGQAFNNMIYNAPREFGVHLTRSF
ncbi:TonB-dependent receptor [Duganella radicis]|uniref:TonB-dependent receptor plug domain-containing protein n=1 Tax=Duganella radicis TaxID=551988 RepID=A0A6L6PCX3_9BURK|nr:TonB-dependent receptor [Duganella radicis]MTV36956.1 TonB-dependent receptor plug domain-containing protein [Duganella radicis]